VAVIKALPTDDEVEAAGAEDVGAFLVGMRSEAPSEYAAWVANWNEEHSKSHTW
jgi:hypothetical protein